MSERDEIAAVPSEQCLEKEEFYNTLHGGRGGYTFKLPYSPKFSPWSCWLSPVPGSELLLFALAGLVHPLGLVLDLNSKLHCLIKIAVYCIWTDSIAEK